MGTRERVALQTVAAVSAAVLASITVETFLSDPIRGAAGGVIGMALGVFVVWKALDYLGEKD